MMDPAHLFHNLVQWHAHLPKLLTPGYALPPLRVAFILTHRCNLKCDMCNVWPAADKRPANRQELNSDEIRHTIRQTPFFSIVTFTGGEPFVRSDIENLLAWTAARRKLHLVSNATLIDRDRIDLLFRLRSRGLLGKGLLSLGISLEGPEALHDRIVHLPGAFAHSFHVLREIAQHKIQRNAAYPLLDLKVVLTAANVNDLDNLFRMGAEAGADIFSLQIENTQTSSYGVEDGRANAHAEPPAPVDVIDPEQLRDRIENLKKLAANSTMRLRFNPDMPLTALLDRYQNRFNAGHFCCNVAWSILHVGPYGDVYPCYTYPMGNVREKSLFRIWNDRPYREFRTNLRRDHIWPGCAGCCVMHYHADDNGEAPSS